MKRVAIGLGSNLGNRALNLQQAIDAISSLIGRTNPPTNGLMNVIETSFLYETKPMHVRDQPAYLNAVCEFNTSLPPTQLLKEIKQIEIDIGRVPSFKYGPRLVDLDILFYDHDVITLDNLDIPHARLHERAFVLRPLLDILQRKGRDLIHPVLNQTVSSLLGKIPNDDLKTMKKVIPVRDKLLNVYDKTYIAGILNVTPDR